MIKKLARISEMNSEALAVHGLDGSEQIRIELLVGQDRAEKTLVIVRRMLRVDSMLGMPVVIRSFS